MDDTLSLDLQQTDFGAIVEPELERLNKKIDDEETARKDADRTLDGKIAGEKDDREIADRLLWAEINLLEIASDVVDIVGTYAALQAYDTSKLQDNDIVKVLKDETHSNATTYYRWNKTTSQFAYIGEEGPYYTTAQTDALLGYKQDTLTAGSNIQINDNTISATDTTYTAGTNVQINGTVISATDTTYTAGTGINITNGVISSTVATATVVYGDQVEHNSFVYLQFYLDSAKTDLLTIDDMIDLLEAGSVVINTPLADSTTKNFYVVAYQSKETVDGTVLHFYTTEGAAISRYYTWADADQFDGAKQHLYWLQSKLSAGSNITIQADTISATDTTYSNFVGTDGTAAGTAGLVPAPATTDAGKFLKADGTWDTAGSAANNISSGDWSALWQ